MKDFLAGRWVHVDDRTPLEFVLSRAQWRMETAERTLSDAKSALGLARDEVKTLEALVRAERKAKR